MPEGRYYVYELIDPRNDAVFYVGKGTRSRLDDHERDARKGVASAKCDRIREIEAAGLSIGKRKIGHYQTEGEALTAEALQIQRHGLATLTNQCQGCISNSSAQPLPSKHEDKRLVLDVCRLLQKMRGVDLSQVNVLGIVTMDLRFAVRTSVEILGEVAKRRGQKWVAQIATAENVLISG